MRIKIIVLFIGLASLATFAQENELKAAQEALIQNNYAAALASLNKASNFWQSMDEDAKTKYYLLSTSIFEAKKDFKTAADGYLSLAGLILENEKELIEQMNKNLSDFDKSDALAEQQRELYKKALPYLEKADKYDRSKTTVAALIAFYSILNMTEKEKEYYTILRKL